MIKNIKEEFRKLGNTEQAKHLQKYFKTEQGEYGEGDIFLGIRVPIIRKIAKKYSTLSISDAAEFLKSPIHEERLFALIILVELFRKKDEKNQEKIYELYLINTKYINNWDLVDVSAPHIVGAYLFTRDKKPIYMLARSENLWERRIAIMSTLYFIRNDEFNGTLKIAEILLKDTEDLIHKAVGWMLREIGKKDYKVEEEFLRKYYQEMPRTMLRYAIEKFPEEKRKSYLKGQFNRAIK
jgi:3-methyladenine DNA glycosylase AlkD